MQLQLYRDFILWSRKRKIPGGWGWPPLKSDRIPSIPELLSEPCHTCTEDYASQNGHGKNLSPEKIKPGTFEENGETGVDVIMKGRNVHEDFHPQGHGFRWGPGT